MFSKFLFIRDRSYRPQNGTRESLVCAHLWAAFMQNSVTFCIINRLHQAVRKFSFHLTYVNVQHFLEKKKKWTYGNVHNVLALSGNSLPYFQINSLVFFFNTFVPTLMWFLKSLSELQWNCPEESLNLLPLSSLFIFSSVLSAHCCKNIIVSIQKHWSHLMFIWCHKKRQVTKFVNFT